MGRRAETKVGHISIVPVHTRYVVVQYRSAAALGAVGRPSEILIMLNLIRRSEVDVGFSVTHRPTASLGRGPFRHGAARPTDPCRAQRGGQNCLFWANLGRKTRPTDPKICKTRVDRLNFPTGRPTFDRKSPVGTTRPTDPPVAHPGTLKPKSTSLRQTDCRYFSRLSTVDCNCRLPRPTVKNLKCKMSTVVCSRQSTTVER